METKKINKYKIQKILEDILDSDGFRNTTKYQELLRYLVNASYRGENVKELTIAIEFFGKDVTFNPSIDSTIRAYISNLRKKLEHYYFTKGREDYIQLTIPKGHYHVEFIQSDKIPSKPSSKLIYLILIPFILFLLLIIIYLGADKVFVKLRNPYMKNDFIWHEWFNENRKVLIVLGNYYFFEMFSEKGREHYIRDLLINSNDDLEAFIENYPSYKNKISKTYNTYLDEHIPFCLSYILPSFVMHNKKFELKLSSEVKLEDITNNNIIYIGPYKCLNILKTITQNLHFKYTLQPRALKFFQKDSTNVFTFLIDDPTSQFRTDYVMVVKVSGRQNNEFILFMSHHDFGNISIVKQFTNMDFLENFNNQLTSNHFEALFEVEGLSKIGFHTKLLYINSFHPNFKISPNKG